MTGPTSTLNQVKATALREYIGHTEQRLIGLAISLLEQASDTSVIAAAIKSETPRIAAGADHVLRQATIDALLMGAVDG